MIVPLEHQSQTSFMNRQFDNQLKFPWFTNDIWFPVGTLECLDHQTQIDVFLTWFDDITSRASNNHTLFNSNNFDSSENERWIGTLTNLPSPIAESTDKFTIVTQNKPGNNCSNGLWYVYSLSRIENMFFSMNLWKYTVTCQDIQSLLLGERISFRLK